ncbi:MAG: LamG-like jellyroll fold domain-containing protein, partial [Planctomycetota bacterium]
MCKKLVYLTSYVLALSLASGVFAAEDPSLIIYYSFDDVGDTVADQSGKGHDGVVVGDVTAEPNGKVNGAAKFEGRLGPASESYLDLDGPSFPAEDIPTTGMTLAAWIKCENTGGHHAIFNARAGDSTWLIHPEARSNGEFRWLLRAYGGTTIFDIRSGVVPWGEWVHFAGIYDKASAKAYVYNNGELVGEANVNPPLDIAGDYEQGARVGYNIDAARPFTGLMDELFLYNRALSQAEVQNIMQGLDFPYAFNPNPADGAMHEDTWATLGWSPGSSAVSHDVYFGEKLDEVEDGTGDTFQGNQTTTFLIVGFPGFAYPDGLVPGTTYYWRIDEIEDDGTIRKGDVWSFTVPPKTAYNPVPLDGAEFVDPNVELSWTKGFGAITHTVYLGDSFDDVDNATGGASQGEATYTPGPLESEKVYYWRVDEFDAVDTHKGDVWSFTTPGAVGSLNPSNGATDVKMTPTLSWTPADSAASHEVYFGQDKDAVRNADKSSPQYKGPKALGAESYDPGKLDWHATYYWRVDAVYDADPDNPVKGLVWSFTTADFISVDDFESYNDLNPDDPESNRIFTAWLDGLDDPANGSVVGYDTAPFAEQTIVHGGSQSMPLLYDNSIGYSEATMTLVSVRDWTEEGVTKLILWFQGDAANSAERMFVAAGGSAVVYHDDPAVTQAGEWTEWVIGLKAFADQGVDLTNVDTISIGFGDKNNPQAGGSGKMYIDDIRLYRPPATGPVLKLDVGSSHNAKELEEGFTSFTIADSGSQV